MSEERTPIEKLLDRMKEELDTSHITIMIEANKLALKDKAHREIYKHTKEDVIEAFNVEIYAGEDDNDRDAEQYYNETHNK